MATNQRAYAFIIRIKDGKSQLLVFRQSGKRKESPYHIPGGGLEIDELPLDAVIREIEEESGLTGLPFGRYIGQWVSEINDVIYQRFYFVFFAPEKLPDAWTHRVTGTGEDAGVYYNYSWVSATESLRIHLNYHAYLRPKFLPELFPALLGNGNEDSRQHLSPFYEQWPYIYEAEKDALSLIAKDLLINFWHIGSTAIPRMVSRPIIDILAVVRDAEASQKLNDQLKLLGYEHVGPGGIPGRILFEKHGTDGKVSFQLHVFFPNSVHIEIFLKFKQALVLDSDLATNYYLAKLRSIFETGSEIGTYQKFKKNYFGKFLNTGYPNN